MFKVCDDCNGRGEIGGFINAENGYQTDLCSSCNGTGTQMLDISPFTDAQWYKMCKLDMSLPVPLHQADTSLPFVYDRTWGLFYVPGGHQSAMALLFAFRMGFSDVVECRRSLGMSQYYLTSDMADMWLVLEGTAFRSSQGSTVMADCPRVLNHAERRLLGTITYLSNYQ